MTAKSESAQEREWDELHERISTVLSQFGTEDHFGEADYLLVDDNYGWKRHKIEIHTLRMLDPAIVQQLQLLLRAFPDWEVVIAVDVPGTEETWPRMGVTIRGDEIIDGLQRRYLPEHIRRIAYPGSKPGTGYD